MRLKCVSSTYDTFVSSLLLSKLPKMVKRRKSIVHKYLVKNYEIILHLWFSSAPPCTAGLDVGIVLDKSKSVKNPNLVKVINFLGELIGKFHPAPDADHFGFITFHNKANMVFTFSNSEYHDKDALLAKIASEPKKLEFETRTDLALKMARDSLFTEKGGDRPDKPNVMIVLTDGKPTKPKGQKNFDFKTFAEGISKDFKVSILQ